MAKPAEPAEPQQLQEAWMQHQCAMFSVFSDQQPIGLSAIDISCPEQPRFLQATLQLHQSRYFQQQALSEIESISGCTFNFGNGLKEKSPAQRKCH